MGQRSARSKRDWLPKQHHSLVSCCCCCCKRGDGYKQQNIKKTQPGSQIQFFFFCVLKKSIASRCILTRRAKAYRIPRYEKKMQCRIPLNKLHFFPAKEERNNKRRIVRRMFISLTLPPGSLNSTHSPSQPQVHLNSFI